jgi:hypothetical protein
MGAIVNHVCGLLFRLAASTAPGNNAVQAQHVGVARTRAMRSNSAYGFAGVRAPNKASANTRRNPWWPGREGGKS